MKNVPAKLEMFRFREKEMAKLLESLLQENERIVPIIGMKGIGKSALARNTLHYAAERKLFTGGILFM